MALATQTTAGTIKLSGDLHLNDALEPQLRPTGVVPGEYQFMMDLIIDGKGRVNLDPTEDDGTYINPLIGYATTSVHGIVELDDPFAGGGSALSVRDATDSVKGVVQVGSGLTVTGGLIYPDWVVASETAPKGFVIVPTSGNIDVSAGSISIPDAGTSTKGVLNVTQNDGLSINSGTLTLNLQPATTSLGAVMVQPTSAIDIDVSGNLTVPDAAVGTKGVVEPDGTDFTTSSGVLTCAVPAAGASLGRVIVGSGLNVDPDGTINRDGIADATDVVKGIVTVNATNGLSISGGVLTYNEQKATDAGQFGIITVGTNIDVSAGEISVPTATNTTLGVAKETDPDHLAVINGDLTIGGDVALKDVNNQWGGVVSADIITKTGPTITWSMEDGNAFYVNLNANMTMNPPSAYKLGSRVTWIFYQNGGGYGLTWGVPYKFRRTEYAGGFPSWTNAPDPSTEDGTYTMIIMEAVTSSFIKCEMYRGYK